MASYSVDLRERIVKAHLKEGQNKSAVARRFGVSRWTVERYVKRLETGSLAPTLHPGRPQRLDGAGCEVLKEQVRAHCDWSLEQHAAALTETTGVSLKKSSVGNYLKRLGITHKKRASQRVSETKNSEQATGPK